MKCRMKIWIVAVACLFAGLNVQAQRVVCTAADSALAVQLLKDGCRQPKSVNLTLYYAKRFLGKPYVASTLEVGDREQLVVNLQGVDCTTVVEYSVALSQTAREKKTDFGSFCRNLAKLRYDGGRQNGYTSRNHYFSWWIDSNTGRKVVKEITGNATPFVGVQTLRLNYMSTHSSSYAQLVRHPEYVSVISSHESKTSGCKIRYIPKRLTGAGKDVLRCIEDGDILAIVTNKAGLDVSHLGFAVWQKGKLHLLNASSVHHKVVIETMTLQQYMNRHPSQIGIRVIRVV